MLLCECPRQGQASQASLPRTPSILQDPVVPKSWVDLGLNYILTPAM